MNRKVLFCVLAACFALMFSACNSKVLSRSATDALLIKAEDALGQARSFHVSSTMFYNGANYAMEEDFVCGYPIAYHRVGKIDDRRLPDETIEVGGESYTHE